MPTVIDTDPVLVSTERLRLEPVRPEHADDLVLLHMPSRAITARDARLTQIGRISRPGLIEGRTGIHTAALFALYRISRNQSSVRTELT